MKPKRVGKYTSCVCGTCRRCIKNEANRRWWFKVGKYQAEKTNRELDLIALQDSSVKAGRIGV